MPIVPTAVLNNIFVFLSFLNGLNLPEDLRSGFKPSPRQLLGAQTRTGQRFFPAYKLGFSQPSALCSSYNLVLQVLHPTIVCPRLVPE